MITRSEVEAAGIASGTDKVAQHGYQRFYAQFLSEFNDNDSIVEIGYGEGNSIPFWKTLYPSAFLYVADKNVVAKGEGFEVMRCDQSARDQLANFASFLSDKSVGFIIDDGSHIPEHQLLTFNNLFDVLNRGGVYIIEDIECSYWKRGTCYGYPTEYGLESSKSLIRQFVQLSNWINREFLSSSELNNLKNSLEDAGFNLDVLTDVASVSFAHNCIAIRKGLLSDQIYSGRPYLHSDRI